MMEPSQVLQLCFLMSAISIALLDNVSALRDRFVNYGPRSIPINADDKDGTIQKDAKSECSVQVLSADTIFRLLDAVATLQVPHEYFLHFYIASLLSSAFWAAQLLTKGIVFQTLCQNTGVAHAANSMSVDQVVLTWTVMALQGTRRLVESWFIAKPSPASKMWFAHWFLGVGFYLAFGVALWIEGAPALLSADSVYSSITISAPSLKTMIGIPIFILASGIQHDCHAYLASLPKYTLPMHPIFQVLICPHYLAECMIYLSLAIIGAPKGAVCNKTILSALVFVGTNLGVTASISKEWYEGKFDKEAVAGRWKMIPWLF